MYVFLYSQLREPIVSWYNKSIPAKTIGYFLIVLAGMFYILWLSEIIPATLNKTIPKSITESGLITNPVHVLDLSVLLPGLIIVAISLLKRKPLGMLLAPVVLTFAFLMDLAIALMVIVMKMKGIETDISGAFVMGLLALFILILLIWFLRGLKLEV